MHRDILSAMRVVHLETKRILSKLDTETALRIAMRARHEGHMEALLERGREFIHKPTELPDPTAPLESWEAEIAVNGQSIIAFSDGTVASVANINEFSGSIRMIAAQIIDFVGKGTQSTAKVGVPPLTSSDLEKIQMGIAQLRNTAGFEDIASLLEAQFGL